MNKQVKKGLTIGLSVFVVIFAVLLILPFAFSGKITSVAKDKINGNNLFEITNRQQAIDKAIAIARGGDMVVVTGKGHENSMNFGHGEVYWDDHQAVKYALEKRKNAAEN